MWIFILWQLCEERWKHFCCAHAGAAKISRTKITHISLIKFLPSQNKSGKLTLRLEIQQHISSLKKINAHKPIQNCAQKGTKRKVICNTPNPECIFSVKLFNQSLVQEQYVPLSFRSMQNTRKKSDRKACRTRQPCSCLVSEREREKKREREKERETRGAGPTRRSSSQLHSREVTMASDKQSTIDHFSLRRRLGAGGRGRRETTEPTAFPPLSSHATISYPFLSFSFLL